MERVFSRSIISTLCLLSLAGWSNVSSAACEGADIAGANNCVYMGGLGVVGGELDGTTVDLAATNMYPFVPSDRNENLPYWLATARKYYSEAFAFKSSQLQLLGVPVPANGIANLTPQQQLWLHPDRNYETETVGLVSMPDANKDGVPDDCILQGDHGPRLELARDVFAYNTMIGYPDKDTAKAELLNTMKLMANMYMVVADEFLSDALEFRFSAKALLDEKLDSQINLLKKAEVCYNKAINSFVYGFGQSLTSGEYLSDYFDDSVYSLFNLSVERMSMALRERSSKELVRLMSPTDQISAKKTSLSTLRNTATNAYLMAGAIASRQQGAAFIANGGDRLMVTLSSLQKQGASYREGRNPLGYDESYVPMQDASAFQGSAQTWLTAAAKSEEKLNQERTIFDSSANAYINEISRTLNNPGGYGERLSTLTGVSIADSDFINKASQAGNDLLECPSDASNFLACVNGKNKGVIGIKYGQMRERYLLLLDAIEKRKNHRKAIDIEIAKHAALINAEIRYNSRVISTLKQFLASMDAARDNSALRQLAGAALVIGVTYFTGGTGTAAAISAVGAAASYSCSISDGTNSILYSKEEQLQQAMTDYRVAVLNATDEATIQNMLNRLVEYEIGIGLATQQYVSANDDFSNSMYERNNLVFLYKRAKEYSTFNTNQLAEKITEARILKNQDAIDLSSNLNAAVHSAYLAAKALEYKFVKPLKNIPLGPSKLDITELYKVQTTADLSNFLDKLNTYGLACSWGSVNQFPLTISLATDVLGLTNKYLNPTGSLTQADVNKKRTEQFQAFLSDKIDKATNSFRYQFPTHVLDAHLKQPGLTNAKIWYGTASPPCDPVSAKGIAVHFSTAQQAPIKPHVTLMQNGHSTYLTGSGSIVEYVPVSKYLNVLEAGTDTSIITRGDFAAFVNTDPNTASTWSPSFKGRSIASSNWDMQINDQNSQNYPIDWSKVKDITIYMEALSFGS